MKSKKLVFTFSKLWNSEYPLVVERIIKIVEKHNPEALQLKKAFDRLVAFQGDLEKLEKQAKASGITNEISDKDSLRDRLTRAIFNQVSTFKMLSVDPYTENAKLIAKYFDNYGYDRKIINENYTSQTENTSQFIAGIEKDTNLKTAFDNLHLTDLLTRLKTANTDFETLFLSRTQELSQIPNVDVKAIRTQVDSALNRLFVSIEFNKDENPDKDYSPLINELTELLEQQKTQIKIRQGKKNADQKTSNSKN